MYHQECIIAGEREESITLAYHPCAKFSGGQVGMNMSESARACGLALVLTPTKGREPLPGMAYSTYIYGVRHSPLSLYYALLLSHDQIIRY